jgi:hypothetical protein
MAARGGRYACNSSTTRDACILDILVSVTAAAELQWGEAVAVAVEASEAVAVVRWRLDD